MFSMISHLKDRYLNTDLHTVWIDDEGEVATFPLWNLSGQLVGYQTYRPGGTKEPCKNPKKRKYIPKIANKNSLILWGMESWYLSNTIFICEGLFDAARFTDRGYSAVATLSFDCNKATRNFLYLAKRVRKVVSICDPGKDGRKLMKFDHDSFQYETGDAGDSSPEFIDYLIKTYAGG